METNTLLGEAMKFVINGRTFDTVTSTKAALNRGINPPDYSNVVGDCELRYEETLYRTAKGAFFIHEHYTQKFVGKGKPVVGDEAKEVSPEEATNWIIKNRAVVLDATGLDLPEEA